MPMQLAEVTDEKDFNPASLHKDASFTQAFFYGEWQARIGRKVRRFLIKENEKTLGSLQMIRYPAVLGLCYLYIPYGPVLAEMPTPDFLEELKSVFQKVLAEEHAIFLRLDFSPLVPDGLLEKVFKRGSLHTYHSAHFQPRAEWYLDVSTPEGDLLKNMHEKTRYNIRLAERKGVEVEVIKENLPRHFESFYSLLSETASRDSFGLHPKKYYEYIFEDSATRHNMFLVNARYRGKLLISNFLVGYGNTLHFVFGGSSNEERHVMPSYLAHWAGICEAKKQGYRYYNFGGVADGSSAYRNWENLSIFKQKFGGHTVRHSSLYDVVEKPFWHSLYNFRKRIQQRSS